MCGIAGWFAYGDHRPKPETVCGLLLANLERGTSATGVAWRDGNKIRVRKAEGPADKFIAAQPKPFFKELANSPIGLLHARATTKGSEKDNVNNHPVVGFEWVVTHNGTLINDDDLWEYYEKKDKVKRFADVDTSVVPLVLSRAKTLEDNINNLSLLSGSATVAAWHGNDIGRVLLARFGHHDLLLFFDEKTKILYWSSAGAASYVMPGPVIGHHKFLTIARLADEHAMLLSPEGVNKTRVFKIARHPFFVPIVSKPLAPIVKSDSVSTPLAAAQPVKSTRLGDPSTSINGGGRRMTIPLQGSGPLGERKVSVIWQPIDEGQTRPWPMNTAFTTTWWQLPKIIRELGNSKEDSLTMEAAYGRWTFNKPAHVGEPYTWVFGPYKRTKEWMERAYRKRFQIPFKTDEEDGKLYTEIDTHWAWEHYDLEVLLIDNSTRRFLGFMCPWCGTWQSAVQLTHNHNRCEFCNAENRTISAEALAGGS